MSRNLKNVARPYAGKWRIVWMDAWDPDYLDMEVEAHIIVREDLCGEFQIGLVKGQFTGRMTGTGRSARYTFLWSGSDENDAVSGRGWLRADGDQANGAIVFELGEVSALRARREVSGAVGSSSHSASCLLGTTQAQQKSHPITDRLPFRCLELARSVSA